jgi:lipoprotein-anchoring transpeptidase ErfK/SrfK
MPTRGPEASYKRLIVVDQDEQMMYVYENGAQIRSIPCSTGKPGEETHTPAWEGDVGHYVGTFFSFGVFADEGWYLFDHYGGMLIHGAPYLIENDVKVYQELDVLGVRPASHGCIRLPPEEAAWLTSWEPQGAHVIITPPRQDP